MQEGGGRRGGGGGAAGAGRGLRGGETARGTGGGGGGEANEGSQAARGAAAAAAPPARPAGAGAAGGPRAESSSDSDAQDSSVAVVQDDSPSPDLRERLAKARFEARGRRHSVPEEVAATIVAFGTWKTLRRERRRLAETKERFALRAVPRPPSNVLQNHPVETLFNGFEPLLAQPPLPTQPPEPEEEATGVDGGQPPLLPETAKWWSEERERQVQNPFKAGNHTTVSLEFKPGERPMPPPNHYFVWGPQLRTAQLTPADKGDFLKIFAKELRTGGCEPVEWDKVDVVTPIHVVRHPVTGKARITHDSRAVNVRLLPAPAEMSRAEDALLRGNVAAKLDLLSAFRHVGLTEADRRVLAFTVDGIPYRWNALTFGCNQSPRLFAQALARTLRKITLPGGAVLIVYVDDLLIVAADAAGLDSAMAHLCQRLTSDGWYIALDKCFPYAMARAPFLGLIVDLVAQRLKVSKAKAAKLAARCAALLHRRKATLADLQKVGGTLSFLHAAAPEASLCRSGINAATGEAERLPGRTVVVKGALHEDLRFWAGAADILPTLTRPGPPSDDQDGSEAGLAVVSDAAGLPSLAYGGVVWRADLPTPDVEAALGEVEGWASDPREGRTVGGGEVFAGPFAPTDASASSGALEVKAVRLVLRGFVNRHGADALRGRTIRWYCDSTCATGAVTRWRAKASGLAAECLLLLTAARMWGCTIHPHWVSRELGWQPVADAISKLRWHRDSPEWRMDDGDVQGVCTLATAGEWSTPETDLFASASMSVARRFVSRWPEQGNAWTDAFARPWSGVTRAWAFPPFSAAAAAVRHACSGRAMDVVVVVPRDLAVPARVSTCRRVQLERVALIDVEGHRAPRACPVDLDAIHIRRVP